MPRPKGTIEEIYDYPKQGLRLSQEGGADQGMRGETNINNIMAHYEATGTISRVNRQEPLYGDVSNLPDLRTAIDQVREAQAAFDALPSAVRAAALNDPVQFMELMSTEEGRTFLESQGLEIYDQVEEPAPVEIPEPVEERVEEPAPAAPAAPASES